MISSEIRQLMQSGSTIRAVWNLGRQLKEIHDATHPAARINPRCRRERPVSWSEDREADEQTAAKEGRQSTGPRILLDDKGRGGGLLTALAGEDLDEHNPN